ETLHQATDVSRGVDADQQMHVRTDHSDLENPGCFLGGDPPEETAQELSQTSIDQGLAVTGSPDDVTIDAVDHAAISRPPQSRTSSYFRGTGSIPAVGSAEEARVSSWPGSLRGPSA